MAKLGRLSASAQEAVLGVLVRCEGCGVVRELTGRPLEVGTEHDLVCDECGSPVSVIDAGAVYADGWVDGWDACAAATKAHVARSGRVCAGCREALARAAKAAR